MQPKKQLKVQYIGIFEEIDSFYWPKMHLWKCAKKFGQGAPPPHLDKIRKNSNFFSGNLPLYLILFLFVDYDAKSRISRTRICKARFIKWEIFDVFATKFLLKASWIRPE